MRTLKYLLENNEIDLAPEERAIRIVEIAKPITYYSKSESQSLYKYLREVGALNPAPQRRALRIVESGKLKKRLEGFARANRIRLLQ